MTIITSTPFWNVRKVLPAAKEHLVKKHLCLCAEKFETHFSYGK